MGEETRRGPVTTRTWMMFAAAMILASVVGIAIGLAIEWFPAQGSSVADDIDTFWDVLLIASVPVFVVVTGIVLFCVWRWRMRPGEERLDGPPIHGNTRLEIYWTAIPTIIIGTLCVYATILLLEIQEAPAKGTRVVEVTAISMMVTAQGADHTAGNLPVYDCKGKTTAELVAASLEIQTAVAAADSLGLCIFGR